MKSVFLDDVEFLLISPGAGLRTPARPATASHGTPCPGEATAAAEQLWGQRSAAATQGSSA